MNCETCHKERQFLETRTSRMYYCKTCHTINPVSRSGDSLGVFPA